MVVPDEALKPDLCLESKDEDADCEVVSTAGFATSTTVVTLVFTADSSLAVLLVVSLRVAPDSIEVPSVLGRSRPNVVSTPIVLAVLEVPDVLPLDILPDELLPKMGVGA